jgi:hypothetical protein
LSRTLFIFVLLTLFAKGLFCQPIHRFDIVIDEVFPDPSPSIGLPNSEFIELKNVSVKAVNLNGWQFATADRKAVIRDSFILEPDSFVIICSSSAFRAFQHFGNAIGVSGFPGLNNEGFSLSLLDPTGLLIHAIIYDKHWYGNELKMEGGWSLEMIDPHNPCAGESNWKGSVDPLGGTPGRVNSVNGQNPDSSEPELVNAICLDPNQILLIFNEPLDSGSAGDPQHFTLSQMGAPQIVEPVAPLFDRVKLHFDFPLDSNTTYQVLVQGLADCAGNLIETVSKPVSLPRHSDPFDVVINEILFNPLPNGYDYVEIYNRSTKTIDLLNWALANRKSDGSLVNIQRLSENAFPVFPGEYLVFSENIDWVSQQYLVKNPGKMIKLESLPSMPDDAGDLILLNEYGNIIDEVAYQHQWHSPLLANEEGVALERMNFDLPSQDPGNWSSAASTAGFGTPTYMNSEYGGVRVPNNDLISVSPKIFSPDHDGYEDFCFVQYQFGEPGYIGNITVFNSSGIPVRYLARSTTFSREGTIRWDGLDENLHQLPMGIYIVYAEIFNLKGEMKQFKLPTVIAGRIN